MQADENYMTRCLQLARLGERHVAPNPMVGAVIVHNDKIIGEGYHAFYGGPHAEVNAVFSADDPSLFPESTIYVSLEPCSHFGKTPPCSDLLVSHKFKRVVIGIQDPNASVNGSGIQRLKNAGIEVTVGVLEEACRELNKHFFTYHQKKRPYILLKWAQTANGLLDNADQEEGISWISQPETQSFVHQLRARHHAILVGRKTVEKDNPQLTVRAVAGINPVRIVLDSMARLNETAAVFSPDAETIVLNLEKETSADHISYRKLDSMEVTSIVKALYDAGIQSVMVEGGAATLQSFIDAGLWDEACIIYGQKTFASGTKAPILNAEAAITERISGDTIITYLNR